MNRHAPELEDARSFEEKRPLLREECLDCRKVDHRGIDFDLPEIGVYRPCERECRAKSDAEVGAERSGETFGFPKGTGTPDRFRRYAGTGVRRDLDRPGRSEACQASKLAKRGYEARGIWRVGNPVAPLIDACDRSIELKPPRLLAG